MSFDDDIRDIMRKNSASHVALESYLVNRHTDADENFLSFMHPKEGTSKSHLSWKRSEEILFQSLIICGM